MNKLISNILKENDEDIDDFFKPKNLKSREEKIKKESELFLKKINDGLKKIENDFNKKDYNKDLLPLLKYFLVSYAAYAKYFEKILDYRLINFYSISTKKLIASYYTDSKNLYFNKKIKNIENNSDELIKMFCLEYFDILVSNIEFLP